MFLGISACRGRNSRSGRKQSRPEPRPRPAAFDTPRSSRIPAPRPEQRNCRAPSRRQFALEPADLCETQARCEQRAPVVRCSRPAPCPRMPIQEPGQLPCRQPITELRVGPSRRTKRPTFVKPNGGQSTMVRTSQFPAVFFFFVSPSINEIGAVPARKRQEHIPGFKPKVSGAAPPWR